LFPQEASYLQLSLSDKDHNSEKNSYYAINVNSILYLREPYK